MSLEAHVGGLGVGNRGNTQQRKQVFKRLIFLTFFVFSVSRCGSVITPFEASPGENKGPIGPIGNSMPFPPIRSAFDTGADTGATPQSSAFGAFQSQKFRGFSSVDTFSLSKKGEGMMHGERYRMVVAPTVLGGTAFVRQIDNE